MNFDDRQILLSNHAWPTTAGRARRDCEEKATNAERLDTQGISRNGVSFQGIHTVMSILFHLTFRL